VQATMNISILMLIIGPKRLDHRPRFLGGGRAIKIDQRMAMGLFVQNREIFAKGLPIYCAASSLVHTIICSTRRCAPLYLKDERGFGNSCAKVERAVLNALAKLSRLAA